jgi:hypothetical protein
LVQTTTRIVWSNEQDTAKPSLSELQLKLDIGWVERLTFWRSCRVPGTPMSIPCGSFWTRDDG